jgi:integrase
MHLRAAVARGEQKESTITTTLGRLRWLFRHKPDEFLKSLSNKRCREVFDAWAISPAQGKTTPPSLYYRRKNREECARFWAWLRDEGYVSYEDGKGPFDFEIKGRARVGKRQLRFGEVYSWEEVALRRARLGGRGALAALIAFYTGLRSAEVLSRRKDDFDSVADPRMPDGRVRLVYVEDDRYNGSFSTKTDDSRRPVPLPAQLWEILGPYLDGLAPKALLFESDVCKGKPYDTGWLLDETKRICKEADLPEITVHGLRGTRATALKEAGVRLGDIARVLGHSSTSVTTRHYVAPGADVIDTN